MKRTFVSFLISSNCDLVYILCSFGKGTGGIEQASVFNPANVMGEGLCGYYLFCFENV